MKQSREFCEQVRLNTSLSTCIRLCCQSVWKSLLMDHSVLMYFQVQCNVDRMPEIAHTNNVRDSAKSLSRK